MARRYDVTVRFMPRELVLFGLLPPTTTGRRKGSFTPEGEWTFRAFGAAPPKDRRSVWHVKHEVRGQVFPVALHMLFVTRVKPAHD